MIGCRKSLLLVVFFNKKITAKNRLFLPNTMTISMIFFVNSTLVLRHFHRNWWRCIGNEWRLLWSWNAPFLHGPPNRDRSFQFNGRYVHPRKRRQHSWSSMTSRRGKDFPWDLDWSICIWMDDCPPFEFAWILNAYRLLDTHIVSG